MIYPSELDSTTTPTARPYVVAFQRQDAVFVDDTLAPEVCTQYLGTDGT
jgi:hypothetical protein